MCVGLRIIVDFDGTICPTDTIDLLLETFGIDHKEILAIEEQWCKGEITALECLSKQLRLITLSMAELQQFITRLTIDESFVAFYHKYQGTHEVRIVSDGLEDIIHPLLARYSLHDCPVFAGRLTFDNDQCSGVDYCFNMKCESGNSTCKCQRARQSISSSPIVAIGDGRSDFCIAHKANFVFAKNKLATYCQEQGIAYQKFTTFADIDLG